jgi:hypothetical protein
MQVPDSYELRKNLLFSFMNFSKIKYTSLRTRHNVKCPSFEINRVHHNANWLISNDIVFGGISSLDRHKTVLSNLISKCDLIAKMLGHVNLFSKHPIPLVLDSPQTKQIPIP